MKSYTRFTRILLTILLILGCITSCDMPKNDEEYPDDLEPHLHVLGEWESVSAPTCVADGLEEAVCDCGYKEERVVQKTEHNWLSNSCTEPRVCADCEYTVPADGHKYADATCHAPKTCTVCQETVGEPLEHAYTEPTCLAPATCEKCGDTIGSPLAHSYQFDATCAYCGNYAPVGPYVFRSNGDGTCALIGGGAYNVHAVIPSVSPEGDVVTSIDGAFYGSSCLSSVVIPDTVRTIGYMSFTNCQGLVDVTIPNSVTEIGFYAFSGCYSLKEIDLPNGLQIIKEGAFTTCIVMESVTIPNSVTVIEKDAFNGCRQLKSITIGRGVRSIGKEAFYNCNISDVYIYDLTAWCTIDFATERSNPLFGFDYNEVYTNLHLNGELVEELVIPDEISEINNFAFIKCGSIKSVVIPDNVMVIGKSAFEACINIESVIIGDGVHKIGDEAFSNCYLLSTLKLGNGVEIIGDSAFSYCYAIERIRIPESVMIIGSYSFRSCVALQSLIVGSSVEKIGMWAFHNTPSLHKVFYTADASKWASIEIEGDYYGTIADLDVNFNYPKEEE